MLVYLHILLFLRINLKNAVMKNARLKFHHVFMFSLLSLFSYENSLLNE